MATSTGAKLHLCPSALMRTGAYGGRLPPLPCGIGAYIAFWFWEIEFLFGDFVSIFGDSVTRFDLDTAFPFGDSVLIFGDSVCTFGDAVHFKI